MTNRAQACRPCRKWAIDPGCPSFDKPFPPRHQAAERAGPPAACPPPCPFPSCCLLAKPRSGILLLCRASIPNPKESPLLLQSRLASPTDPGLAASKVSKGQGCPSDPAQFGVQPSPLPRIRACHWESSPACGEAEPQTALDPKGKGEPGGPSAGNEVCWLLSALRFLPDLQAIFR